MWDHSYQVADELPQALVGANIQKTIDETLYTDSGAGSHITSNSDNLTDLKHYNGPEKIHYCEWIKITHNTYLKHIRIRPAVNVLVVVPKINKYLLSVSTLANDNCCTLEFDETNFVIKDKKTKDTDG